MKILFIHQNFPAQFGRLASWLARQGHQVVFLTRRKDLGLLGVQKVLFAEAREAAKETHRYLRPAENAVLQGQAAYRSAYALKQQGFVPDVIYGHVGFGATLFMKDLFPATPFVGYFEWYYHAHNSDADFEQPVNADDECRIRVKNLLLLSELSACTAGVTPTYWQHRQFPTEYLSKLRVLHDGIDTDFFQPAEAGPLVLKEAGLQLPEDAELVTYVGRGMEPYRGFLQFMEAASILLRKRKKCHIVIVGEDRIAYSGKHASGKSYKEVALEKFSFDPERLHFTGALPLKAYRSVIQASTVHVYLTYPFVLSWSLLESMSCGCTIVGSDTPPLQEVIRDGYNGLLAPFHEPKAIAQKIEHALDRPALRAELGKQARGTILERYSLEKMLPQHALLLVDAARHH